MVTVVSYTAWGLITLGWSVEEQNGDWRDALMMRILVMCSLGLGWDWGKGFPSEAVSWQSSVSCQKKKGSSDRGGAHRSIRNAARERGRVQHAKDSSTTWTIDQQIKRNIRGGGFQKITDPRHRDYIGQASVKRRWFGVECIPLYATDVSRLMKICTRISILRSTFSCKYSRTCRNASGRRSH